MSEQPVFTPGREKDSDALARFGITDEEERRRAEAYEHYYGLRKARERDRDGRTRLVLRWKLMDDFDMDHFERYGRHFVRVLTMDAYLSHAGLDGRVVRGGAVNLKPDEECRAFLRRFKEVQAAREALYDGDDDDVPLRAVLGGEQVFTPWRENEEDRDWDGYVRELKKETHKRPKGYAAWRPQKKTTRLIMQVRDVLEEYRNYLPMTARQIFYRLVGAHDYPKTEAAYKTLCEHLVRARRAKMIPFDHIRDDGISMAAHSHYADENAFYKRVHDMGKAYKRDKLARQGLDIRVYCEAAGMIPQLNRVCEPYSVPIYSCSGFDSLSGKYELKESCWRAYTYQGRKTVVLHLGDHDPSGESIFNDGLVQDVHAFLAEDVPRTDPRKVTDFERVALTAEQVVRYNLETEPPKATDSRTANWEGATTGACQLEALPPDKLAELLEAAIKARLNLAVYEEDLKAEEEERRRITKALPAGAA